MRKLLTFLFFTLLTVNIGRAADESVTFSEQNYSNKEKITSYSGIDFSVAFDKGTNSTAPTYYTSGTAIRVYGGNCFTVSSTTKTITKIEITFGSDDGSNAITTDVNTYSNGTWTGSATGVTFTVGGTSGNRRIAGIAVTYQSSVVTTYYSASVASGITNGTIELDKTTGLSQGDEVTVTATPDSGYKLSTVTVTPTTSGVTAPTATVSGNTATFQMPASDVTVSATFVEEGGGSGSTGTRYERVTSISASDVGKEFILVCESKTAGMGAVDSYGASVALSSLSDGVATITDEVVVPLTLGGSSGAWTFALSSGNYLSCPAAKKLSTSNTATAWTVSFSGNDVQMQVNSDCGNLQYNAASPRFACYTSSQTAIQLYKKVDGSTPVTVEAPTFNLTSGTTYTEAQTLTIGCATNGATIRYNLSGTAPATASEGTAYSSAIPFDTNGTYTVTAVAFLNGTASASSTISFTIAIPETPTTEEGEATFIFNTDAGLAELGIDKPASNAGTNITGQTYTKGDVSFTSTKGSTTDTRVYNSSGTTDLRVYSSGTITLSVPTDPAGYSITKIVITGSSLGSLSATGYSNGTWTGDATSVTLTASGTVKINTITVTYTKPSGGSGTTYTEVTGISGFKALESGTTVKLYLPDLGYTRVLHVKNNGNGTRDVYVRDNNGGAMLMQGVTANREPAYGQHLAGWIVGTYSTNTDGMPLFVPVSGVTNTANLVIADPVSEAEVMPNEIDVEDMRGYLADWVVVKDVDSSITLQNEFNTSYTTPYTGAIVDVSAIAASSSTLYPITHNEVPVITYVLDSSKPFTLPNTSISGTSVRVKRSLTHGVWAPLTLPFDYSDFDGTVQQFDNLTATTTTGPVSGKTFAAGQMNFTTVSTIVAGVPYLVKPNSDITEFTASNVTLTASAPATVTRNVGSAAGNARARAGLTSSDDYSFIGVYSPTVVPNQEGYKVMDAAGNVTWATEASDRTVDGSSAYFQTPADQGLVLKMEGESGVITGIDAVIAVDVNAAPQGIYNGMGVKMPDDWQQLPPGFYIVNGVKTIKR